jgi:acetyl-CoA C-acetyltransferase/acetyl-CoA acyltransferase
MQQAFIIDAIRSPLGRSKPGSAFTELHATELLAQLLSQLVQRNDLDPGLVDDVITGCVTQAGEQSAGLGAWPGWQRAFRSTCRPPPSTASAVRASRPFTAAQGIMAGAYDIVIACGIESMSRVPMGAARIGQNPYGPSFEERYAPGLVGQGVSAELVAAKWELSRHDMDSYSARSHQRAAATRQPADSSARSSASRP